MYTLDINIHKRDNDMIITFCGHSDYLEKKEHKQSILEYLDKYINGADVDFYLGGYGNFDNFAYNCAKTKITVTQN